MNTLFTQLVASTFTIDPNKAGIPQEAATPGALAGILGTVFLVLGSISVLYVIIGAIRYVTSGGDSNGIARAKDTILYAIIGLVVTVSSWAMVKFVLGIF